jgi:FkbM family methyltransferase
MNLREKFHQTKWKIIGKVPFGYSLTFNAILARMIRNKQFTYFGLALCFIANPFDSYRRKILGTCATLKKNDISIRSQNLQDVAAITFCKKNKTYLDLGAAYPIKYSNSHLLQQLGWRGILVEPNKDFHQGLMKREDQETILLKVAIGIMNGKQNLQNSGPLSTLIGYEDSDIYGNLRRKLSKKHGFQEVEVISIAQVMSDHYSEQNLGYLSIDIEGMDVEILEAILIEGHRPTFVSIEHNFVIQNEIAIRELAKNYGYRIICRKLSVQDYWLLNDL